MIQRNILENPGWYTAYTPYQAEVAQGRLEALLNYQTMVSDLTGLPVSNASLLDEATAAAEAMGVAWAARGSADRSLFFVSRDCHPQTIEVVRTRAKARGITVVVGDHRTFAFGPTVFGALVQYPASDGAIYDYASLRATLGRRSRRSLIAAADLLASRCSHRPASWGADIAVGSSQRFGVPLGFGGPHAAFFACREEFTRQVPGRVIGVSRDVDGHPALRMALQTREQHIRREKATSNICTAEVLLAVMAGMYAVWHGPEGLRRIARAHSSPRWHVCRRASADSATASRTTSFFDTVRVELRRRKLSELLREARAQRINVRVFADEDGPPSVGVSIQETTTLADLADLFTVFNGGTPAPFTPAEMARLGHTTNSPIRSRDGRRISRIRSSTAATPRPEMLRYIRRLEARDLSLTTSMIPLGSCTMKLNATAEMLPVTWREVGQIHPFAPSEQTEWVFGLFERLESALGEITGLPAVSLQPNAGSQGEYAGLLVIRRYHEARGEGRTRDRLSDPAIGARHESRRAPSWRGCRSSWSRPTRAATWISPTCAPRPSSTSGARRAHDHVSVDARGVRGEHPRRLRDRACGGGPGVSGRGEHERDGRPLPPGGHGRGRLSHQPAQDVLHPARRRRAGHGADRGGAAPRALPARPSALPTWEAASKRSGRCRAPRGAARASCRSPTCTCDLMGR